MTLEISEPDHLMDHKRPGMTKILVRLFQDSYDNHSVFFGIMKKHHDLDKMQDHCLARYWWIFDKIKNLGNLVRTSF
jgi:hypothetical protein